MVKEVVARTICKSLWVILFFLLFFCISCSKKKQEDVATIDNVSWISLRKYGMIKVRGGTLGDVSIIDDFYISDHEVTQDEWDSVMQQNPSVFKGEKRPVENVSWYDAVKFCNELSRKNGLLEYYVIEGNTIDVDPASKGFRLPTFDEWKYAAGGGEKSKGYEYSGSDDIDLVAWYKDNAGGQTSDVKTKKKNELGLYDMSGNVYEWCWDETYVIGKWLGTYRTRCGGGWDKKASLCKVGSKDKEKPSKSHNNTGFRIACSV